MSKRALSLMLVMFMLFSCVSIAGVSAEENLEETTLEIADEIVIEQEEDELPITEEIEAEPEVSEPSFAPSSLSLFSGEMTLFAETDFTISGNKLTAYIGAGGNVIIPDGVTVIGAGAFKNKTTVTGVTIPSTVQIIENEAFMGSGLISVTIPDSVVTLGYTNNKSGNVEMADSGTNYTGVFTNCANLTSATIGSGINYISPNTFKNCTKLLSVNIASSVTKIGAAAFFGCTSLTTVALPSNLLTIESGAFARTGLISVTIPSSVTSIQSNGVSYANNYSSSTVVSSNIFSYVFGAFTYCPNLTSVTFQNGVTYVGEGMFSLCSSLVNVSLPVSITQIQPAAFLGCANLSGISLPQNLLGIGVGAFSNSGLTSINIPNSVTTLGTRNYNTSMTNISDGDRGVFNNCSNLISVVLGNGIATIPDNTFKDCTSLTTVSMSDDVTSIGKAAFYNDSSLTGRLTLPRNLAIVGHQAFQGISNIRAYEGSSAIGAASAAGYSVTVISDIPLEKVATVTANPSGGAVRSGSGITLSTATNDAQIRYTTDGTEPTASSTLYTSPIAITTATTIKAKAFKSGMTDSDTATFNYTITTVNNSDDFEIAVTSIGYSVTNYGTAQTGKVIMAIYDTQGRLIHTQQGDIATINNGSNSGSFTGINLLTDITNNYTVKLFVWLDTGIMMPLADIPAQLSF